MSLFPQQKKIVITQGVIELGVEKRQSYQRVLAALRRYNGILLTTDAVFGELSDEKSVITFNDVSSLMNYLHSETTNDTLILIEGRFSNTVIQQLI